jgi:hypothetical protein
MARPRLKEYSVRLFAQGVNVFERAINRRWRVENARMSENSKYATQHKLG